MNNINPDLQRLINEAQGAQQALQATKASEAGLTPDEYVRRQEAAERAEQKYIQRSSSLNGMDLPISESKKKALAAGKLKDSPAIKLVRKWWLERQRFKILILAGPAGTGKTFAALNAACEFKDAVGFKASQLGRRMQPIDEEWGRVNVHAPFIVLDDLGTENPTEFWLSHFDDFIDTRKEIGLTIITANMSNDELRSNYSERVISRLEEAALMVSVGTNQIRDKSGL